MRLRLRTLLERLRASFFLIPMFAVVVAVGLGLLTIMIDTRIDDAGSDLPLVLASTVESARALLGTIAGATITFAGIAFSISLLVIQGASSQFSPRVVHTLFRDPFNKRVMGVVIGTFTYCLIVLRSVRSSIDEGGEPVIPNLSVAVAVVLGITAILAVVAFINHSAHAMDVSEVLEDVKHEALEQIRSSWPPLGEGTGPVPARPVAAPGEGRTVRFERSGWVQLLDVEGLLDRLPAGATMTLHTYPGRYAIEGTALCTVVGADGAAVELDDDAVRASVGIGETRTMQQDVSYGLRQLVDVALRGLSPGINDPTTAQDAIFHATAVLSELLRRSPAGTAIDEQGRALLVPEAPDHPALIRLTFDEVRRAAADSPTVCIYLLEALRLLREAAGEELSDDDRGEITSQACLVVAGCEQAGVLPADLATVREAFDSRFG